MIASAPDPVWEESFASAPSETIAAVSWALEDLVLASPDLRPPALDPMPDGRAKRHLSALVGLWRQMGDALPEGLAAVRHVLDLPRGRLLAPLPVVAGSLDPLAPASMRALHDRLVAEFGMIDAPVRHSAAPDGSRLHALQGGLSSRMLESGEADASLSFFGLRDAAACAEFAAARARALIEAGVPAREIAVLAAGDPSHLARAFAAQGVPLSGLPGRSPIRDTIGETALHLALAKRPPTPSMVLASLALSPQMPWAAQTGRDLAERIMGGDSRGLVLDPTPDHKALWEDIRAPATSLQQLRFLIDRICERLPDGPAIRARLSIPPGEGSPDWETILRAIQIAPSSAAEPERNLEGVSLWSASESPWRPCRHLIVSDFTDGFYPARPRANPLFLDSEIDTIQAATGLRLRGRAEGLARGIALLDEQLQAVAESVTFLVPWRDLAGARLAPAAGLSLIARAIADVRDAKDLIVDLSRRPPEEWPVAHHRLAPLPDPAPVPEQISFNGRDLLKLWLEADGTVRPQSPTQLETLMVSPLAWLLDEIGASDLSWSADALDVRIKGNVAHDVFERVFPAGAGVPDADALALAIGPAFERALSRHAAFLRGAAWDMERTGLEREIRQAALRWRDHLLGLGARILGIETWLAGEARGIRLRGKADTILELPDGAILIVDHKKSGTAGRRARMERGWDLQVGLYRDMLLRPIRNEGDGSEPLIGRTVGIGYHLMNDGGLLTSGLALGPGSTARDMGDAVNEAAMERLELRMAEVGNGRIVLNTSQEERFFKEECGFTPYALTDGSPLVRAFIRDVEEE
ncbi:PD-(D/E)XK nuclease family protein [Cereibacter sphaeroides]|uniref:PD-(D/E)XK nuclease family protein n=1 Tax=Cereibacter sphaeroides TaxID=1063 RepID=UPI001F447FDB|nr:PD-(D/E)XK nuclease family protein [Cereibacter sphaeroides]MCE6951540.1 PD-(D/E)XK nuclease family protein [Cereibacter sphaeroides]